jgi:hypothetical protein
MIAGPASLPGPKKCPFANSDDNDDDDTADIPQKTSGLFTYIHSRHSRRSSSHASEESSDDTDYGPSDGLEEMKTMGDNSFVGFSGDEDKENSTSVIDRRECPANFYFTTNQLALCPMEFESDEDAREHVQKLHT